MDTTQTILHADMDAFFAAVEQRDDPALAGRPVIVGGLGRRGVVSAASYEARRYGVHSALPTAQARQRCPQGVYLPPRMEAYAAVSRQLLALFARFTDLIEPLSLDEAFLDVSGSERLFGDGQTIARRLRAAVREETALTVSVGVATSKFVAKVASDLHKPDGLTVVPAGTEEAFLAPLPLTRLWGAGATLRRRLAARGWQTLGDLQALDQERLVAELGESSGVRFHALCRGWDERPVLPRRAPRSISRETTFAHDLVDHEALAAVLLTQAEDVGRRLRRQGLAGRTVRLKLRFPPFETHTRQARLEQPSCDDACLYQQALALLCRARSRARPVRLIGVGVSDLVGASQTVQGELFERRPPSTAATVNRTLDAIRERFGSDAAGRLGGRRPGIVGRPVAGPVQEQR